MAKLVRKASEMFPMATENMSVDISSKTAQCVMSLEMFCRPRTLPIEENNITTEAKVLRRSDQLQAAQVREQRPVDNAEDAETTEDAVLRAKSQLQCLV